MHPVQQASFDKLHKEFREHLRGVKSLNDEKRYQLMNGLLDRVKAELTPEQWPSLELSTRRLRPDLTGQLLVRLPTTQPAAEKGTDRPAEKEKVKPTGD